MYLVKEASLNKLRNNLQEQKVFKTNIFQTKEQEGFIKSDINLISVAEFRSCSKALCLIASCNCTL
jgi:hypothetical protein